MLLELDYDTIQSLINDPLRLKQAVRRAKQEYIKFTKGDVKEAFGEELFELVCERHADEQLASQLTGMLLELDATTLGRLVSNPTELDDKISAAYTCLMNSVDKQLQLEKMACQEHKDLANTIKETHVKLRKAARERGGDEAWQMHVKDEDTLKEYASAMHKLATEHWDKNDKNVSRIQWVVQFCSEYFKNGGQLRAEQREENLHRVFKKIDLSEESFEQDLYRENNNCDKELESGDKLCLLDVGSCYNPFKNFDIFDHVIAVDLVPATEDVMQCDFLNLDIDFDSSSITTTESPCKKLPASYFNVVVFSLLLEYLPCKKQRWTCCVKACKLLKPNGLLIIITPDSKHASANSKLMKSWRLALAGLGFILVKSEKHQHLNCLAYRKCFNPKVAAYWLSLQKPEDYVPETICIPQDFSNYSDDEGDTELVVLDRDSIVGDFSELPSFDF
ncbi:S-adenosylmethionine sensor upstream of mTORC1 isoform X2 [Nilaparvata lugens]|nr:S-adenosylmethionine sensor upstream of mTORC1 isoform X2 [Nilaparvata lugens]XP_039285855.1 S-adenosylmethionine sensor upstream of mTORC1 isoform X2 [Nilaparvata lugens]XP_039285856.1 S-adenosylmethionine sensor upstream of mTORC1 isoform X2 [Nilaparvata lugens]